MSNQPKNITQSLVDKINKANVNNIPLVKTNIGEAAQRGMAASRAFRRAEQLTKQLELEDKVVYLPEQIKQIKASNLQLQKIKIDLNRELKYYEFGTIVTFILILTIIIINKLK